MKQKKDDVVPKSHDGWGSAAEPRGDGVSGGEAGGAGDGAEDAGAEGCFRTPEVDGGGGAGDGGVEDFASQEGSVGGVGEDDGDGGVFGALALVDGGRPGGG